MRQAYEAFVTGGHAVEGTIYVLEGIGPSNAKQELIQAAGEYDASTAEFVGHLSPRARVAWQTLQHSPADVRFAASIQQGLNVALNGLAPPFAGNPSFAGSSMAAGLQYLADLSNLVTGASQDLHHTAAVQASSAMHRF